MPVYFLMYVALFWIPSLIMGFLLWPRLDDFTKKAFWITIGIMVAATTIMEIVYIRLDIWLFSQKIDPLLGVWIWKIPIEEFVFWYGASPLFLFMYLSLDYLMKRKA